MAILSEKLRSYFLGELSADEAVRLENECLGDNVKFAELREAENDLLDDYVNHKLPPQVRKSFEENYLNSPFRQQRLEFAQALDQYLQNQTESTQTIEQNKFAWLDIFSFWKISAVTTAILLLVFGGFWILNYSPQTQIGEVALNESPDILPSTTPIIVPKIEPTPIKPKANVNQINTNISNISPTPKPIASSTPTQIKPNQTVILALAAVGLRDGGKTPQAIIGKDTKNVVLQLDLGETEAKNFQIKIVNADGATVYQINTTRASGKKINVNLPANLLKNDDYVAEISTTNADGETEKVSSYNFRITKK